MRTLSESLFDQDIINKEVNFTLQSVKDLIDKELEKYHLNEVDWEKVRKGYIPNDPYIIYNDCMGDNDGDFYNFEIFVPNGTIHKKTGKYDDVSIGISFCIAQYGGNINIERMDIMWVDHENDHAYAHSSVLWDLSGWKRHSKLKSNRFTEKNLKSLLDYIKKCIDTIFMMAKRDQQEICDIYMKEDSAASKGDPLMYGRKDRYWYIEKMRKELEK